MREVSNGVSVRPVNATGLSVLDRQGLVEFADDGEVAGTVESQAPDGKYLVRLEEKVKGITTLVVEVQRVRPA